MSDERALLETGCFRDLISTWVDHAHADRRRRPWNVRTCRGARAPASSIVDQNGPLCLDYTERGSCQTTGRFWPGSRNEVVRWPLASVYPGGTTMSRTALVFPVLPGKDARDIANEMKSRPREYEQSRRRLGITMERAYLQHTPMGDFVTSYIEAEGDVLEEVRQAGDVGSRHRPLLREGRQGDPRRRPHAADARPRCLRRWPHGSTRRPRVAAGAWPSALRSPPARRRGQGPSSPTPTTATSSRHHAGGSTCPRN